jgi:hypothetical protein
MLSVATTLVALVTLASASVYCNHGLVMFYR